MGNKKTKGLLDDMARKGRFSDKNNQDKFESNGALFNAKYASSRRTQYAHQKPSVAKQIRIASQYKEAVVKVTNYGRDTGQISAHISYISRNHTLDIENQDGDLINSPNDSDKILNHWDDIYFDNKSNSRNTVHITFSTPEGTNREHFNAAIRQTLYDEFEGRNDYLFVQHDDTEHPHAHAIIVMRSIDGKKLDPRKQYLTHLRNHFAKKCREQGIKVEASRRFERGLGGVSRRSEMVQMHKQRGVIPERDIQLKNLLKREDVEQHLPKSKRNIQMRTFYTDSSKTLLKKAEQASDENEKRRLTHAGKLIGHYAINMPSEPSLLSQLKQKVAQYSSEITMSESIEMNKEKEPPKRGSEVEID